MPRSFKSLVFTVENIAHLVGIFTASAPTPIYSTIHNVSVYKIFASVYDQNQESWTL